MKSIDEMCAVMQAYKEGKKIEYVSKSSVTNIWRDEPKPIWDWDGFDYRVKEEPHYVPYDSVTEVEKDKWVMKKGSKRIHKITSIDYIDDTVFICEWENMQRLFDEYTYEDGTPCGKLIQAGEQE